MRLLFFFISFFIFTSFGDEIKFPKLTGPVVDEASFLNSGEKQILSERIFSFYESGGFQIQIVTVNNLNGYPIEEYAIHLAETWKIGRKKEGDGIIILIAKEERALRIEVGQGIEDKITDYQSSQILHQILIPAFANAEFFNGLNQTLDILTGDMNYQTRTMPKVRTEHNIPAYFAPLFFISFFLYIISYNFFRKNKVIRVILTMLFFGIIGFIIFQTIAHLIFASLMGLLIGVIGPLNFLILLMHSSGRGGRGGFGGGRGGSSWGGGGGGFSGGGASGRW